MTYPLYDSEKGNLLLIIHQDLTKLVRNEKFFVSYVIFCDIARGLFSVCIRRILAYVFDVSSTYCVVFDYVAPLLNVLFVFVLLL